MAGSGTTPSDETVAVPGSRRPGQVGMRARPGNEETARGRLLGGAGKRRTSSADRREIVTS